MPNSIKIFSPGRINIIGEHIDYNDGFVLPASIDLGLTINAKSLSEKKIIAKSDLVDNIAEVDFTQDLKYDGWLQFLYGTGRVLVKKGYNISGLELDIKSTLPIGSGLSSSSALILGVLKAFDILYNLNIKPLEAIEIARTIEHQYIGVIGGIMDQYAITFGEEEKLVLIDCKEIKHSYIPFDISGYHLVLFNSNVEHNLASSEYNTRRKECDKILEILNAKSYRDLDLKKIDTYISELKNPVLEKRLKHVSSEFTRVQTVVDEIKSGKGIEKLKAALLECHLSLSKNFEVSCDQTDFIVDFLYQNGIYSRMMGGGFGGSILSLVPESKNNQFIDDLKIAYKKKFDLNVTDIPISIGNGITVLERE